VLAWGSVGDADSTLMLMDTGLVGATFVAPDTVFRALGLGADAGTEVTGIGGGGAVTARVVTVPRIRLGGIERRGVPAMMGVFPPALEHQFGFPIRGLISHDFLRRFAVTWDFDAMELVLR
jgi:Aspartyl protease